MSVEFRTLTERALIKDKSIRLDGTSWRCCQFEHCELVWDVGDFRLECCKLTDCLFPKSLGNGEYQEVICCWVDNTPLSNLPAAEVLP